jgi:hypothetical protein
LRRLRRRPSRVRRAARADSRRDPALAQPEQRAANLAAQRAAHSSFHLGEHRRRFGARDRAERSRDRTRAHAGRGAQLVKTRERLGGGRCRVEARFAELGVFVFDVVSHRLKLKAGENQ